MPPADFIQERLVFRCVAPPRTDKVYIIDIVTVDHGQTFDVITSWGRWNTYRSGGSLQHKVYGGRLSLAQAQTIADGMVKVRLARGYKPQPEYSTYKRFVCDFPPKPKLPSVIIATNPLPQKKRAPPKEQDPRKVTRAGLLEFD